VYDNEEYSELTIRSPSNIRGNPLLHKSNCSAFICICIMLPSELLEIVFSCLPLHTLLGTCNRVCKSWNDVISRKKFLQWRKLYYKYKLKQVDDDDESLELSSPEFLFVTEFPDHSEDQILWLLHYVESVFKRKPYIFSSIVRHHDYGDGVTNITVCNSPWSSPNHVLVATWLILKSEDTWAVRSIIQTLLSSSSSATTADVTEYLYLLATFLLYFSRNFGNVKKTFTRIHYQVFHALYFLENEWSATPLPSLNRSLSANKSQGQQSLMNFGFAKTVPSKIPTAEQLRIIQHPLVRERKDLIKIVAFAGTGKTTTLVKMAESNPHLKFLLIVYNKSVRIHAESQFPANVVCKTVHQMAWAKCGFMFNQKMTSNLKAKDILDSHLLTERGDGESSLFRRSGQVLAALNNFLNSSDLEVDLDHVPTTWTIGRNDAELTLSNVDRQVILEDTRSIWRVMIDKDDKTIRMPHDGYLKLWQLRNPSLQRVTNHDVLLLDEGQDMNPTMLDIFMNQSVTRVIVGDPNQQIYMFRGAVNALGLVSPTHTYFLTQSFRFGPEIGFVANICLTNLKKEDTRTLVGGMKRDSYRGTNSSDNKNQVAFIGRSNLGIFEKLNKLIFDEKLGKKIGLVGGVDSYNLDDYLDIFYLYNNQKEKMKKYKNFKSYASFAAFAKNVGDVELLSKISIIEKFKFKTPDIIAKIKTVCVSDLKHADIALSTIHKAKGLEFDTVVLLNDFNDQISVDKWPEDEKNLLYVAITRAKTSFVMNSLVLDEVISGYGLVKPTTFKPGETSKLVCSKKDCLQDLSDSLVPGQLMIKKEAYSLSSGVYYGGVGLGSLNSVVEQQERLFCKTCSLVISSVFKSFINFERGIKRKRDNDMKSELS